MSVNARELSRMEALLSSSERRDLRGQLIQPCQQLPVALDVRGRLAREERDAPSRVEHGAVDVVERREPLLVRRRFELESRDQLAPQGRLVDDAVVEED